MGIAQKRRGRRDSLFIKQSLIMGKGDGTVATEVSSVRDVNESKHLLEKGTFLKKVEDNDENDYTDGTELEHEPKIKCVEDQANKESTEMEDVAFNEVTLDDEANSSSRIRSISSCGKKNLPTIIDHDDQCNAELVGARKVEEVNASDDEVEKKVEKMTSMRKNCTHGDSDYIVMYLYSLTKKTSATNKIMSRLARLHSLILSQLALSILHCKNRKNSEREYYYYYFSLHPLLYL